MKPKIIHEFDLYLPLTTNRGKSLRSKVEKIKRRLVEAFGGVTDFRHRNEGIWKFGNIIYKDEILILRVLFKKTRTNIKKLDQIALQARANLKQKSLLIVRRKVQLFSE